MLRQGGEVICAAREGCHRCAHGRGLLRRSPAASPGPAASPRGRPSEPYVPWVRRASQLAPPQRKLYAARTVPHVPRVRASKAKLALTAVRVRGVAQPSPVPRTQGTGTVGKPLPAALVSQGTPPRVDQLESLASTAPQTSGLSRGGGFAATGTFPPRLCWLWCALGWALQQIRRCVGRRCFRNGPREWIGNLRGSVQGNNTFQRDGLNQTSTGMVVSGNFLETAQGGAVSGNFPQTTQGTFS